VAVEGRQPKSEVRGQKAECRSAEGVEWRRGRSAAAVRVRRSEDRVAEGRGQVFHREPVRGVAQGASDYRTSIAGWLSAGHTKGRRPLRGVSYCGPPPPVCRSSYPCVAVRGPRSNLAPLEPVRFCAGPNRPQWGAELVSFSMRANSLVRPSSFLVARCSRSNSSNPKIHGSWPGECEDRLHSSAGPPP
jgi:hypothetical protein